MKKRLLAFLLVLIMVIGMLPTSVFAASLPSGWTTTKPSGSVVSVYGTPENAIKSGPVYSSKWYNQVSTEKNTNNYSYTIPQVSTLFELNDGWTIDYVSTSNGNKQPGSTAYLKSSGDGFVYYFKTTTTTPTTYDHVLKYNLNGGTSTYTFPEQRKDGATATSYEFTIHSQSPTHATNSLKTFLGWADSASATAAQYQPGGKITVSGTKTIYAVWSDCNHKDDDGDGFCDGCNKCMHTKSSGSNCSIPDCDHGESCTCGGQPSELPPTGGDSAPSWNPDLMLPDENMSFGFDIACSVNSAHDLFVDKSSAGCTTNAGFFGECCTVNTTAKQNASTGKYYFEITLNAPDNYYPDGHTADTSKTNTPIKLYVKQTQGGTYTLDTWTNGIYYVKCEQVPETKYAVNYHFLDADGKEIDKKTEYFTEGKHAEYTLLSGKKDGFTFDGWYEKAADIGTASKKLTSLKTSKKYELYGKYTAETMNVYVYFQTVDTAGKTIVLNAAELTANGLKYNSSAKDWMTLGSFTTTESTLEKLEAEANSSKFVHHADNAPITPSMIECFQLKTLTTSYGFPDGKAYHLDGKLPFAKITFDSGAGESETVTGMPTSGYYYKGKTISATPTREGYDFLGWENVNESNGGGYVQTVTVGSSDAKYTAVWQKREITLHYDANGGTGAPADQTYTLTDKDWAAVTISETVPTRDGYIFKGWSALKNDKDYPNNDHAVAYTPGATTTIKWDNVKAKDGVKTIYAVWEEHRVITLKYNANGGDESSLPAKQEYELKTGETYAEVIFSTTEPTREGYKFLGWSTQPTEDTYPVDYTAGSKTVVKWDDVKAKKGEKNVYAVWEENRTITITYHANGGDETSVPAQQSYKLAKGETYHTFDIPDTIPTRKDHFFKGWTQRASSTTVEVNPATQWLVTWDEVKSVKGEKHLYAIWEEGYTVTVTSNPATGVTGLPEGGLVHKDSDFTLTQPTCDGYIFVGWVVLANDKQTTLAYDAASVKITGNTTLTAVFSKPTVTLDKVKVICTTNGDHTAEVDAIAGTYQVMGTPVVDTAARTITYTVALSDTTVYVPAEHELDTSESTKNATLVFTAPTNPSGAWTKETKQLPTVKVKCSVTVTFDANGGETTPEPQVIPAGSTAVRPEDPTYSGYRFDGWFLGDSETAFDFDTPVTANITLTAKWTKLYPVKLVIYRNGDFEKAYKTIDLDSLPKGETYDVSALDIADYYTANATGKYDFHGFYNDGLWNEYKANPEKERAGLTSIKINGWTNLKCMVYDYEKVCLFKSYDDVIEDKAFAEYEALHGANIVDFLNDLGLELDQEGHTHDEWYKKDSPKWKFSDKDTFNGWTNVLIKYTVNEYNVTFKLNGGNVDGDTADIVVPVKWNTTVTAPENVVRQTGVKGTKYYYDYKLVGWLDADGNEFDFTTPVKDNLTLTAYWQPPTKMSSIGMVRTSAFIARCTTDEDHPTFAVPSLNSPSAKTATLACVDGTWTVVMSFNAATTISTHCKSEIKTNWGGIKHTYAGNNTEYLRMAWDETAEEWYPVALSEYNKKTKDYDDIKVLEDNIFYLDCTCVTKPADPTATDIAKIILAGRDTTNKDSLVKYKNGTKFKNVTLIDGTYTVGEVTGNRADGFHVTVTLTNLQPYADALNANRTDLTATAGEFVLDTDRNTLPMVLGLKIDGGKTDLGSAKWEVDKTGYTKTEELNGKNFYLTHEYTVTFDADGGTPEPDAQKVVWGKTATEPTAPEKTNYDFLGWFEADSETAFDFSTPITASVTLTAHWKLKIYTVKYHGNGGYLTANPEKNTTTSTGTIGQELTLKNDETFTREHYNFLGWATTETATEAEYEGSQVLPTGFDVEPGSTVDLYAVWQIKTYTICSDLRVNGNEAWQAGKTYAWTYRYGDEYGKTIDYTDMFAALKAEALNADAANSPNADKVDIVLCFPGSSNIFNEAVTTYGQDTATWNPSNDTAYIWGYATMYYDVTFDTNGGTTEAAQLVKFNELVTEPTTAPTKEGNWRFKGWYTDADCTTLYDFTTPVTKSMTLYAGYDKTTSQLDPIVYYYEVHHIKQLADTIYDDDDNVDADYDLEEIEIEHLYAEAGTNATATAKDYGEHFHVNNGLSTFSAPVIKPELDNDGNVVFLILEIYYDRDTHTLTYDPNGGSLNGQQATYTVRCGSVIMDGPLLAPTRAGYRFTGWYADADCNTLFDFDAGITADTTVYAGWVSDTPTVQTFRLTINYVFRNGTTAADSVSLDLVAGTPYEVKSPTVRGYYPNRRVVKGTMPEENITLTVTYYRACYMIPTVTKVSPRLNTSEHFAYVQGYPDGTVRPQNSITRAETAAILFRLMDEATRKAYYSTNSGFKDVTTTNWYNTYVATLNNAGIITDSANGYFRPNDAITRAELAAMLAQFADKKNARCYFTDVYANYWAANAIATCASLGWITGYPDGSFRPDNSVTRAELMAMINRALGRTPHAASDLLAGMNKWSDNANTSVWYYLHVQEATNSHTFAYAGTYEYWTGLTTDPDWSKYE